MKTAAIPTVRRNVEYGQVQLAFIKRALDSSEEARKSGRYVSSSAVLGELASRLSKAHERSS